MSMYSSIGSKKMTKYTRELTFTELKHNYHNTKHIKKYPFEFGSNVLADAFSIKKVACKTAKF